jgi:translation initiation factor 4A
VAEYGAGPVDPPGPEPHHHHQQQQQQQLSPEEAAIRDLSLELKPRRSAARAEEVQAPKPGILILAATDACLKALPKSVLPVGLPLLIQFDMPATKVRSGRMLV